MGGPIEFINFVLSKYGELSHFLKKIGIRIEDVMFIIDRF